MKFKIEVDLDWVHDEYTLDEQVESRIVSEISKTFSEELKQEIQDKAQRKIEENLDDSINKILDEFLGQEITVTDRWGDVKEDGVLVKDLIKRRLDNYMNQQVNNSGRAVDRSYSSTQTRIDYLLGKRVEDATKRMSKEVIDQVNEKIRKTLNDSVKNRLSESLLEKIDVEGITESVLKKSEK